VFRLRESDVSAVVLTCDEPTTPRAIASLEAQSAKPNEIIVVRGVCPFHRAFNAGVKQVKSRFFVQVDADMILDPECLARLRRGVTPRTGVVVGHLRDELIGRAVGVKLFRTACCKTTLFSDSISPDTDFLREIGSQGWKKRYVGRHRLAGIEGWDTLGEHRPNYTPLYTYRKYLLEGQRYQHRGDPDGVRWHFSRLEISSHPMALIAQIALARGMFVQTQGDRLGLPLSGEETDQFARTEAFLHSVDCNRPNTQICTQNIDADSEPVSGDLFSHYVREANACFISGDGGRFQALVAACGTTRHNARAWFVKVALCYGLTPSQVDPQTVASDYEALRRFADAVPPRRALTKIARSLLPFAGRAGT